VNSLYFMRYHFFVNYFCFIKTMNFKDRKLNLLNFRGIIFNSFQIINFKNHWNVNCQQRMFFYQFITSQKNWYPDWLKFQESSPLKIQFKMICCLVQIMYGMWNLLQISLIWSWFDKNKMETKQHKWGIFVEDFTYHTLFVLGNISF
jgi:hypothetical protein